VKIVLSEVFRVLCSEIENWPVSRSCKKVLLEKFSSYENIYDGFVTATDSSEIRLKPHRDLYSIALHQLGIPTSEYDQVIGFEDSESGTIAIRAAGIGLCLAVPFSDTQHHDFRAASHVLHGGLPEAILKHNVFLKIRI
jgi:beta-phosphoglucomutase-like phosphatase (HAD superfamily)